MLQTLAIKRLLLLAIGIGVVFFLPRVPLVPIPFFYVVPVLWVVWLLLKANREKITELGFSLKGFEWKAAGIGLVCALVLFVFLQYAFFPLLGRFVTLKPADLNDFRGIRHHFPSYIFIVIMGWLVGGFYEELVFHGYIFNGINHLIKGKTGLWISFLLTGTIFGLYHFQLGLSGVINALLAGLAYQGLMLKFNRNLWYSFFFHGFFDTIALTYIYLGYW